MPMRAPRAPFTCMKRCSSAIEARQAHSRVASPLLLGNRLFLLLLSPMALQHLAGAAMDPSEH
eukprot:CAMPEP_0178443118 /NCGR_PEP_ID=MMETSP0689_2-20121128/38659_1 /TAXON_ID=160604 /ORGANISM="Amphidinium massartii, Strain CS-259" /LENGTH=62 /DNA_ID=CAMNT_0020066973 /DNA_START=20 /DNA_END=205 /DNA_ORIENTATION=+